MRNRKDREVLALLDDRRSSKYSRNGEYSAEVRDCFGESFRPHSKRQNRRVRRASKLALRHLGDFGSAIREAV